MMSSYILTHEQIEAKIQRLAAQVYECFCENPDPFLLAGIQGNGMELAKAIASRLPVSCKLCTLSINKKSPDANEVRVDLPAGEIPQRVVLVDDVCNTGSTLFYAAAGLAKHQVSLLKTLVLIDRYHRNFPIHTDFVGLSLATTLQNHIRVECAQGTWKALLENQ